MKQTEVEASKVPLRVKLVHTPTFSLVMVFPLDFDTLTHYSLV